MEMVFSLCESMTYELALRHCYAASYTSSVGERMAGVGVTAGAVSGFERGGHEGNVHVLVGC